MTTKNADIGLIGLAIMGQNLVLNMADHGYNVAVYNRTTEKMTDFIEYCKNNEPSYERVIGHADLATFVLSIKRPRKIVLLVKAGTATDLTINALLPFLEQGDIIIDGGNALWTDTIRREKELQAKGLEFIGSGVSGGETGARFGPSLMPSGTRKAWESLEPIWRDIAAKVDPETGEPMEGGTPGKPVEGGFSCAEYIGPDGAGHYVKMVHNGIEYIDMQLICEAYWLMKTLLGMKSDEIGKIFEEWNKGDLSSFLIEITADILQQKDPMSKEFLVDMILDTAGQKGTGQWTAANALELGAPANAIAAAVYARALSSVKEERVAASKILKGPKVESISEKEKAAIIDSIKNALYCSKICAYAQGFQLIDKAQVAYNWKLNFGEISQIWRGGCIIRARFLQKITDAYALNSRLKNLMLDPYFTQEINKGQEGWRKVITLAVTNGIPAQGFAAALAYYDGYRSADLPANLLQGQRDYFGGHTYERKDKPRGEFFHLDWPEPGRPQIEID
ncbi:MAG: phosphogluconate dehydrogenase (NADP(+)-dependent, decarboxylating) [Methylophilaceae bacterium]|nr:MAG: phosphogluconate dehydrogenase (NADP(+)-dependent, decarboxylating) [Methylophilaceae bacterium]